MQPEDPVGFLHELNWLDLGALIILTFFLVMGMIRGFTWQALQVVKLFGGIMLANLFAEQVGGMIPLEQVEPRYRTYLAYVLIFVCFAVAISIAANLLDESLKKLKLKSYDRLAGGGLGLASGWLMLTAVVTLLYCYPPLSSTRGDISASYSGAYAARTALLSRSFMPTDIRDVIEKYIDPEAVDRLAKETKDRKLPIGREPGSTTPTQGGTQPAQPETQPTRRPW